MPGAFKLHHLQPLKPNLFLKFGNFFTFILGVQFLLPQRANNQPFLKMRTPKIEIQEFECLEDNLQRVKPTFNPIFLPQRKVLTDIWPRSVLSPPEENDCPKGTCGHFRVTPKFQKSEEKKRHGKGWLGIFCRKWAGWTWEWSTTVILCWTYRA